MSKPILTVVVPTRNRPSSIRQLLISLTGQTLSDESFEVIVVDDGSDPPLRAAEISTGVIYPFKVLRREANHGAHASRREGLQAASGRRVVFLDDDVEPSEVLLERHATLADEFAVGPILYHPAAVTTPYQRYQAKRYAAYERAMIAQDAVAASDIYICNASGATNRFAQIFEGVDRLVGASDVAGDGLDEELMNIQLKLSDEPAVFLRDAVALHVDTKSLDDARRERRSRGATECRLLLSVPEVRSDLRSFETLTSKPFSSRILRPRLFWAAPRLFSSLADICTFLADRFPPVLVPAWICYPPMAIAFWEGMRAEASSFSTLRAALLSSESKL